MVSQPAQVQESFDVLMAWDGARRFINTGLLALGFPLFLVLAMTGHPLAASAVWVVGYAVFYVLEHATGRRLRRYLEITGQPVPEFLTGSYIALKRIPLKSPDRLAG